MSHFKYRKVAFFFFTMPELVEIVGLLMWLALNLPVLVLILMLRMPKLHKLLFVILYFYQFLVCRYRLVLLVWLLTSLSLLVINQSKTEAIRLCIRNHLRICIIIFHIEIYKFYLAICHVRSVHTVQPP